MQRYTRRCLGGHKPVTPPRVAHLLILRTNLILFCCTSTKRLSFVSTRPESSTSQMPKRAQKRAPRPKKQQRAKSKKTRRPRQRRRPVARGGGRNAMARFSPFSATPSHMPDGEPSRCFTLKLTYKATPLLYGDGVSNYKTLLVWPGLVSNTTMYEYACGSTGVIAVTSLGAFPRWPLSGQYVNGVDVNFRARVVSRGVRVSCNQPLLSAQGSLSFTTVDTIDLRTGTLSSGGNRTTYDAYCEMLKSAEGTFSVPLATLVKPHVMRVPVQDTVVQRVWERPIIGTYTYSTDAYDPAGGLNVAATVLDGQPFRHLVIVVDNWTTGVASLTAPLDFEFTEIVEFKAGIVAGQAGWESIERMPPRASPSLMATFHDYVTTPLENTWRSLDSDMQAQVSNAMFTGFAGLAGRRARAMLRNG